MGGCLSLQAAPKMDIYEAINRAGYQRMLTQRIAKCYLGIVVGIDANHHKTYLQTSTKTFEQNLIELKSFAPTPLIKDQFRYIEILWRNYKFVYGTEFSREKAATVLKFNNKILGACNQAVKLLEKHALKEEFYGTQELRAGDQELSQVINLSGRQRMLTQRAALYAIAKAYQIGDDKLNKKYYFEAVTKFAQTYRTLVAHPYNTAQIYKEYDVVEESWEELESHLTEIVKATSLSLRLEEQLNETIRNSELLLFSLDEIVFLYERQKGQ